MNELETNKQRANLLAQARVLLNEEYQQRRAEQYSKWQLESNHLWVTKGILLPYPSSFGYPTEEEVVKKALELYNKQNGIQTDSTIQLPATDDSMTASVTAKLNQVSQNVKPVTLPPVPQTTPWEQYIAPQPAPEEPKAEEPKAEEPKAEESAPIQNIIQPAAESPAAAIEEIFSKPALEFPPLLETKPEDESTEEETKELSTAEELEQVIEEVLEKESDTEDKKQSSTLRALLAQFVTLAKKLDADKNNKETK
jgi:hypothetical protein